MLTDRISVRWPGTPGTVRVERHILSGLVVYLRRDAAGWHYLATTPVGQRAGRQDSRRAAMRAAVYGAA